MFEPLAFRLRPLSLKDVIGQEALVGPDSFLSKSINEKAFFSIVLFGPPGTGKTTIAEAYARDMKAHFVALNAVTCSKKDIENAIEEAKIFKPCFLLLDEVHRLDKIKQDYLLPFVESGTVFLIGATTANPFIALSQAIRSRCRLLEVKPLPKKEIVIGLKRAIDHPKGLNKKISFEEEALEYIASISGGDLRFALNVLEECYVQYKGKEIVKLDDVKEVESVPAYFMDKDGEEHYDSVSALQKSIRGQDVDAALYYLARLCASGDLESIKRRLLVTAYEDIGLANPNAVMRTKIAIDTAFEVGLPEALIPLGDAVIDLCLSPHSRAGADSIEETFDFVTKHPSPVQEYLKYTPVNLLEEDKYPYDRPDLWEKIRYLPDDLKEKTFYKPSSYSQYEKALNANYERLLKQGRSNRLRDLKKK